MATTTAPTKKPVVRRKYVVIIQVTELQKEVYGPYTTFKAAEGDAKAWNGTVEPLKPINRLWGRK